MKKTDFSYLMACGIALLLTLALSGTSIGATWQGAGTGGNTCTDPDNETTQWGVTGNWSGASVPGSGDTVTFDFANAGAAYAGTATVEHIYIYGSTDQAAFHIGTGVDLSIVSSIRVGYSPVVGKVVQDGGTVTIDGESYGGLLVGGYSSSPPDGGYYDLSGTGQLTVKSFTSIGSGGASGVFTQTGGTHTTRTMTIGTGSGSTGTYTLSGGTLSMSDVVGDGTWCNMGIGSSGGTGTFTQTGGVVDLGGENDYGTLSVGCWEETTGNTYTLSGTGRITGPERGYVRVGTHEDATGTFTQTGGTVDVRDLGVGVGSLDALYEMSGSAQLRARTTSVGWISPGTFTQSAGTHIVNQLYVSCGGSYILSGTGQLVVQTFEGGSWCAAYIGKDGAAATFTQTGGSHTNPWLFVALFPDSDGTYLLSDGEVNSTREYISYERDSNDGLGLMEQSGGSNTCSQLIIAPNGTYRWTGGTLDAGSITVKGDFDFDGSSMTLSMPHGILDVSEGTFSNAGSAGLVIGAGALLMVPEGYDPADVFASYVNNGWMQVAGADLAIGSGQTLCGSGTIKTGTLTNSGGIAPGNSAGVLHVGGDYVQETVGDLLLEIGGYSSWSAEAGTLYDYDRLEITGSAALEGIIEVSLIDGFSPVEGDTFDVLVADNGVTIGSGGLALTGTPGFSWRLTASDTTLQLQYSEVPEPATLLLVGSGAFALIACARRRRKM